MASADRDENADDNPWNELRSFAAVKHFDGSRRPRLPSENRGAPGDAANQKLAVAVCTSSGSAMPLPDVHWMPKGIGNVPVAACGSTSSQ